MIKYHKYFADPIDCRDVAIPTFNTTVDPLIYLDYFVPSYNFRKWQRHLR